MWWILFDKLSSVSLNCRAIFENTAMVGGGDLLVVLVLKGETVRWEEQMLGCHECRVTERSRRVTSTTQRPGFAA